MSNKRRVKSIVMHKRPPKSALEANMEKRVQATLAAHFSDVLKAVNEKFTQYDEFVKNVAIRAATEAGQCRAVLEAHTESIEMLDTNVLCTANILKEIFG